MVVAPSLLTARVMHKRLFPKENAFHYGVYYLALPLPAAPIPGHLASFDAKDLGYRDGRDPTPWVRAALTDYGLNALTATILLVTMPRVLGYTFNPVSFYLCCDGAGALRAVVCEVHNTFGEQHSYVCALPDHGPITATTWLEAKKVFHVSPFLTRTGTYKFRFDFRNDRLGVWIDYYDAEQKKQLVTALTGTFTPLNRQSLRRAFWSHPLVTLKSIMLIHWQAVRLVLKGLRIIRLPPQTKPTMTASHNLNKK